MLLTQNRNLLFSALFTSSPRRVLRIRAYFLMVMVFVLARSPYVLITHGWYALNMVSFWNFLGEAAAVGPSVPFGPCPFCATYAPVPFTLGDDDIPVYDVITIPVFGSVAPFVAYPPSVPAAPEAAREPPVMLEMSRYETDELLPTFVAFPTKVAIEVDMYGGIGAGGMPRLPAHSPAVCPPVKPSPVTEAYVGTPSEGMFDAFVGQLVDPSTPVPFDISFVEVADVVDVDDDFV